MCAATHLGTNLPDQSSTRKAMIEDANNNVDVIANFVEEHSLPESPLASAHHAASELISSKTLLILSSLKLDRIVPITSISSITCADFRFSAVPRSRAS